MLKKMEQAKKKAEAVVNTVDISEKEKMSQLKRCDIKHPTSVYGSMKTNHCIILAICFKFQSFHLIFFSPSCQYLQESWHWEGEERSNIRCEQKRSRQEGETSRRRQGSL